MANNLQFKRGTTARRLTYTPVDGELVYDKTLNRLFMGNGSTAGGVELEAIDNSKAALDSPALVGVPTGPTATDGTSTTQLATAAFVQNTVGGYLTKTGLTGGTVTLTDTDVSNAVLYFSGTLTSNLVIVVPVTNKRLWAAINATTGAFTLTVKTSAGTGVTVAQGKRNLIYTDGTNVQDAFNDFESIALTGTPTAPTQAVGTNNTRIATTAFVQAEILADTPTKTGTGASGTWGIGVTGNAASATKLATPRTINGTAFDGTANINVGLENGLFLGTVLWFNGPRARIPTGYVAADGQLLSRATFPDMWAEISGGGFQTATDATWLSLPSQRGCYTTGNGTSTFRLPDLNGTQTNSWKAPFLRGDGNGIIAGESLSIGRLQNDAIRNIMGEVGNFRNDTVGYRAVDGVFALGNPGTSWNGNQNVSGTTAIFDASTVVPTALENRPVSAVGVWIIKISGAAAVIPAPGSAATLLANTFNGSQSIVGNLSVSGSISFGSINGFDSSLAENGYQKLPNGYIEQWGYIPRGSSGVINITFPIAFPRACFNVLTQLKHTTQNYQSTTVNTPTTTGFQLYWDNGPIGIYWTAKGY